MNAPGAVTVRHATVDDASALGQVHVRARQAAYRGHMPDDYLDGLRAEERAAGWDRGLRRDRAPVLVAEWDGRVVGRPGTRGAPASCTPSTSTPTTGAPEPAARCSWPPMPSSPGSAMRRRCCGCCPATAARHFYQAAGRGAEGAERGAGVQGVVVPEVRYRRRLEPAAG